MSEQIFYISGPMSDIEDHNYPFFEYVAQSLRKDGLDIRSPHELSEQDNEHTIHSWEWYIERDLEIMKSCTDIIMLPGWTKSKGAAIELKFALDNGYHVWRLESFVDRHPVKHGLDFLARHSVQLRIAPIDRGMYDNDDQDLT